jgi:hypothetical protein
MSREARALAAESARELLRQLAAVPSGEPVRVAEAGGGLACLVLVWPAGGRMPTARAERRTPGARRAGCRADVLAVAREVGRPLTRKEVVRALRDAGLRHGAGTVAKALAELTRAGELVNLRDKRGYRLPEQVKRRKETPSLF